jgi:Rieske Fe-S protein
MADDVDRREFLQVAAGLVTASTLAGLATRGVALAQDTDQKSDKVYWVATLGKVKDLNEKKPVLVKAEFKDDQGRVVDDEKIYVRWEYISKNKGRWIVLSSICQHLKCMVKYAPDDDIFRCPCHGSEYDLDGSVTKGPSKKDLPDYSADAYEEDGLLKLRREAEK